MSKKHVGLCEINNEYVIAPRSAIAYKYADPTEDARWLKEDWQVEEITAVDPSLISTVFPAVYVGEWGDGRVAGFWFALPEDYAAVLAAYEKMDGLGPNVQDAIRSAGGIYVID